MDNLFYQLGLTLLKAHSSERADLFAERRMVFFAETRDGDGTEGESDDGEESPDTEDTTEAKETKEQKETVADDSAADEVNALVDRMATRTNEKVHGVLDIWEYEFPADVDPDKLKEARKVVNEYYPELQKLEERVDRNIARIVSQMKLEGNDMPSAPDEIWKGVYYTVPEFTQKQLRENDSFDESMLKPETSQYIKSAIVSAWAKYGTIPPRARDVNVYAEKLTRTVKEIARNEFEMLKVINEVREVMVDMHESFQKQSIEQRLIRSASRRVGIPLVEGQELEGMGIRLTKGLDEDKPFIDKFPKRWKIKEVYVDKMKEPDLSKEDLEKYGKDPIKMSGVWVSLEEKPSGRIHRMSTNRLRDYINIHDVTPAVHKQKDINKNVIHLSEIGMTVEAGDTLEYDVMQIDPNTNKPSADVQKVKILSIDDHGVKFEKKVFYRSFYDSPDLADHEYVDEMTLGEFARWMNHFRPLPEMKTDVLLERLDAHYDYMNDRYKRNKDCHLPIQLIPGEILHADAPGNPLFEVESIDELTGLIKLKKNRTFTFPQFLRWVYENDIEPYDPDLEALKMKTYFNAGKKSSNRAKEDAEATIDHFKKTGVWRDTLQKLREKGIKGIFEPKVPFSEDQDVGAERQSYSQLAQWMRNTQWLRLDDIFKMFKMGWEYYVRNWERRQKARYSAVGKNVPWFGTEFERINQEAETQEVNQFKEAMDQWGVPQIEETLYGTNNQDQAKACLNVLAEKGMLRWDDKRLYHALNKFTDINHKLPIPTGDPYKKFAKGAGKFNGRDIGGSNVIDFLQDSMDSLWGEGSYVGWKRQSDGAIESAIQQSYNKGEELENDPKNVGGIAKELSNLLTRHMAGEWIDPTEYEGLLRFIIEMGKAGGDDKIYYLLMGVNARNPDGRTILGWERIGRFVSKYGNQFPALDYFSGTNFDHKRNFTTGAFLVDDDGNPRPFTRSDFDVITQQWLDQGKSSGVFNAKATNAGKFLMDSVLTTDAVQARLEKGIRNAQNMDHDDSPYYIPALKESEIESICASTGGDTKKFTIQGYKNGYVGFGMRMKSLVSQYEQEKGYEEAGGVGYSNSAIQKLVTSFKSYMNYDGILDNRFKKKRGSALQRLSSSDYQTGCVWDGNRPLKRYQDEMQSLIKEIAIAYGHGEDPNIVELPFQKGAPEDSILYFGARFEKMVRESDDGGEKLMEIVKKHEFLIEDSKTASPEDMFRNRARMYEYDPETITDELPEDERGGGSEE